MSRTKPCDGKVYAQTRGEKRFNWNRFLNPKAIKSHSEEAWNTAAHHAGRWATCACGNQCAVIPRGDYDGFSHDQARYIQRGEPLDLKLSDLGMAFHSAIKEHDAEQARGILVGIEARSTAILVSMGHLKPARKPAAKPAKRRRTKSS